MVDADAVALLEPARVVDGAEPEVALHHLARRELDALPGAVHLLVAADVVEPVEQARRPSRCRPPTGRSSGRGSAPGCVEYSQSTAANIAHPKNSTPMVSDGASDDVVGARRRRPDVQAHHGARLRARGEERIPVAGVQRRQAEPLGELGERHRVEAARRRCAGSRRAATLGVEEPRQLARDDAARVACPPTPRGASRSRRARPRARARDRSRRAGSAGPAKPGERRREVQRRVHAVEVHVVHARVDVPRAAPHLVEARRVERSAPAAAGRRPR